MKQKIKQAVCSVLLLIFIMVICYSIGNMIAKRMNQMQADHDLMYIEIGQKVSDVEWLHRFGYISSDEMKALADASENELSLDEFDALLDDILDGKKDACLENWNSILDALGKD